MSHSNLFGRSFRLLLLVCFPVISFSQLPSFPGAEGAGSLATGGRGGDVYHVTNLNDDGVGSLRYAIETASDNGRTIVFDISGTIALTDKLKIEKNNLTIAGQTAPGQGICIKGRVLIIGNNMIVRHLHFRPWEQTGNGDALNINGHDIIVDHCSASWSSDEVMSTEAGEGYNITVQWNYIYEGLNISYHYENGVLLDHSMGSLFGTLHNGAVFSVHHNLYAHNRTRNPKPTSGGSGVNLYFDCRNNVIYDWGTKAGYSTDETDREIYINYVGNYLIAGPSTKNSSTTEAFEGQAITTYIYQDDNKIDADQNTTINGVNTGWDMFTNIYTKRLSPYALPAVTTSSPDQALSSVLDSSGALWWNRDTADRRVTNDVKNNTGQIIDWPEEVGGWPNIASVNRPVGWDTDMDGMPDSWELQHNSDPNNAADRNGDNDSDGYTNLEEYLNAIPFAEAGPVPVKLISFTAKQQNDAVNLNWKVAATPQPEYYIIERAEAADAFHPITTIKASNAVDYSYIDGSIPSSDLYYRLKQVDASGEVAYSAVERIDTKNGAIHVYPNPVSDKLIITGADITKAILYNAQGQKIKEFNDLHQPLWVNDISEGVYTLMIYSNSSITTQKIVISR